jgi:hypothetical protein
MEDDLSLSGANTEQRVLVVIMNSMRDFRAIAEQGWYRIPVKRAPRQLAADYLAFYQTAAFPDERWSIRYYAPIKRFRIVSRKALLPEEADHPRAEDLYYKIELGPLAALPRPIPSAKLRRVTFIPTTLDRLLEAEDVCDLWEGRASAQKLWEALQDRGIEAERGYEICEGRVTYCVDLAIFCQKGNLAIDCVDPLVERESHPASWDEVLQEKGWSHLRFTPPHLSTLDDCVRVVETQMQALGGALAAWPADLEY